MCDQRRVIRKRILVVDDDQEMRNTTKLLLELDEHSVTQARSAREALELVTPGPFDLVITAYDMAQMRGDELAARLKRLAPSQPILMLSGSAEALGRSGLQVEGLLGKPFSLAGLRQAIARLC